jgi:hypothetical protein
VTGFVGGERSTESYTQSTSHTRLGIEATRAFSSVWMVEAGLDWRNSTQQYSIQQSGSGGSSGSSVDENRFDFGAAVGYDFGPRIFSDRRLQLMPLVGVKYIGIRNRAFPSDLVGPQLAGRAAWSLSPGVVAQTEIAYAYNLSVSSSRSALGAPTGDLSIRAGLQLPIAGNYSLGLNYQGDVLVMKYVYRVAHGAAVGFGYSF